MHRHARHWISGLALLVCVGCDATDSAPPGPTADPDEELGTAPDPAVAAAGGGRRGDGGSNTADASGSGAPGPTPTAQADGSVLPVATDASAGDAGAPFATLSEAGVGLLDAGTLPPGMVSEAGAADGNASANGG
jgi:hypothetical protein